MKTDANLKLVCYHCGEDCHVANIMQGEKAFCCTGCRMVFNLLNRNGMCSYYDMNTNPGTTLKVPVYKDKFAFLDDISIQQHLILFKDEKLVHVCFYLPQVHCSSCLWLLEHLQKLSNAIVQTTVNFPRKEILIVFNEKETSLRKVAELLTAVGYEPYISLKDLKGQKVSVNKSLIYQLGIAGFCFANIMMLSFPEYLGMDATDGMLQRIFRGISLFLSLPVLIYCARPFYMSAFKSLRHGFLNIDAPIAIAIFVTFFRSVYEILLHNGNGFLDSMSGIVFFMLIGRTLQDKTYRQLSFDRDYTSYFPIAISVIVEGQALPTALPGIKPGDTLLIHNEELVPVDGIITRGRALIDYSFVTGESLPVLKEIGEIVYAGGKQKDSNFEMLTIKEVSQSYLTSLWNKDDSKAKALEKSSFVDVLARYFTYVVLAVALIAGAYWQVTDPTRTWNVVTSILIIACPCALLLASTFTNGNVLRILARNHFFLRNALSIQKIAATENIVFDKTGTLTSINEQEISFIGFLLTDQMKQLIASLAIQSTHPLARAIADHLDQKNLLQVDMLEEQAGNGIKGVIQGMEVRLGSRDYLQFKGALKDKETRIYVSIDDKITGYFTSRNIYRKGIEIAINQLKKRYRLSVLSGDNDSEKHNLETLFGKEIKIRFHQKPHDKQEYIHAIQQDGKKVMMIGDGLNDAIALKQSDIGIAVCEQTNNFTPASDGILKSSEINKLPALLSLCRYNKIIVKSSFVFSIAYNLIGIYFSVQGLLSPLIAAILMPASSVSILLLTFGTTNLVARQLKL